MTILVSVNISLNFFSAGKYDGAGKTPKLLPCSHTVCLECLQQISNDENLEDKHLNCPICRERILIPTGGVSAIPPAFLVNQLLELMRKQKRELVSRCNSHPDQELAYCETCDEVFCGSCKGFILIFSYFLQQLIVSDNSHPDSLNSTHTIVPFSIATARMSEILSFRATESRAKLSRASSNVLEEIHRLDHSADDSFTSVNLIFDDLIAAVERKRSEYLCLVKQKKDEKKKILENQLETIEKEKNLIDSEKKSEHLNDIR